LSSANPQLQTPFTFTIHEISVTTNPTVTRLTHTASLCPSILQSSTTVASLSHSTTMTSLQSANCTLLAHEYWTFTQPQDEPVPVLLWIFPLIQLHHHNTSSCGTTAPHPPFWLPICHPLSQKQWSHHRTLLTSFRCFSSLAPKSHMSRIGSTTKASSVNPLTASTALVTNHTSIKN
jgi:hypothetical protein